MVIIPESDLLLDHFESVLMCVYEAFTGDGITGLGNPRYYRLMNFSFEYHAEYGRRLMILGELLEI